MNRALSVLLRCLVVSLAVIAVPANAGADIYTRKDADGVVHFTNIRPRGKSRRLWKRLMKGSPPPGKAAARRGSCERCDIVPARDRSPERFLRYDEHIREAAALYNIPPALIRAVIKVESDYDPRVVSAMNARGLMQLMPGVIEDMGVRNVHDPRENILGGTRLLRVLANRFDGDLVRTIAAYHAGMGAMERYDNDVPPYENTRKYLRMVLREYYRYKEQQLQQRR
jgi:soluble lytic murein transglycosylase-like protein